MTNRIVGAATGGEPALDERVARVVAAALRDLMWGTVTVTLHGGVVVSVDRLERTRLSPTK
jgi:hypothetical protein